METERLMIRVPTIEDFDALYLVHADPETNIFNPGWKKPSKEESMQSLSSIIEHHNQHGFGYYALVDKEDNRVFGICGLRYTKVNNETFLNLYYRISPSKMRRGFVKEAANKIIEDVTKKLNTKYKIVVVTLDENIPSRKIAESLGLKYKKEFDNIDGEGNVYYFN